MIIKHTSSPVITSGDMEDSKMGIDPDNSDFVASLLRDRIYTDKILAPIRELICNAFDATIEANSDGMVDVKLFNVNDTYTWSVRDQGFGLSEDDVRNVFGRIGSSKKRHCNKQIGMFGIGSLSPFSYTDTYHITSHYNGLKSSYCATLVAGAQAVSVGTLYKVSEEPTTETGIEVSFDVTQDYYTFHTKTKGFVNNLPPNFKIKYTDCYEDEPTHTPNIPILSYVENGYVIHSYATPSNYVSIRMGGVVYQKDYNQKRSLGTIIVDVPIGKLTIPPSRESLDQSKSNDRVIEEIQKIMANLYKNDSKSLKLPKFGELVGQMDNRPSKSIDGDWYSYSLSTIFPDTYILFSKITRTCYNIGVTPNVNGQYMIYVLPNNSANKSWSTRLYNFLSPDSNYGGYITIDGNFDTIIHQYKSSDTLDLSDCIFVDVKKMKLPPIEKYPKPVNTGPTRYTVYNSKDSSSYTAQELLDDTKNVIYDDPEWLKSETLERKDLHMRSIGMVKNFGRNNYFWTTSSVKMYNELITLGFVDTNSIEYKTALVTINDRACRKSILQSNHKYVSQVLFGINSLDQVARSVSKNYGKLERLKRVKTLILSEDSLRSRLLTTIDDNGYKSKMTRSDLRAIMKLK
jgi:Histidine kinase-, DNA gyrase B-, and HSP90-like ATPase